MRPIRASKLQRCAPEGQLAFEVGFEGRISVHLRFSPIPQKESGELLNTIMIACQQDIPNT